MPHKKTFDQSNDISSTKAGTRNVRKYKRANSGKGVLSCQKK
jgi:hypothetical protein